MFNRIRSEPYCIPWIILKWIYPAILVKSNLNGVDTSSLIKLLAVVLCLDVYVQKQYSWACDPITRTKRKCNQNHIRYRMSEKSNSNPLDKWINDTEGSFLRWSTVDIQFDTIRKLFFMPHIIEECDLFVVRMARAPHPIHIVNKLGEQRKYFYPRYLCYVNFIMLRHSRFQVVYHTYAWLNNNFIEMIHSVDVRASRYIHITFTAFRRWFLFYCFKSFQSEQADMNAHSWDHWEKVHRTPSCICGVEKHRSLFISRIYDNASILHLISFCSFGYDPIFIHLGEYMGRASLKYVFGFVCRSTERVSSASRVLIKICAQVFREDFH